jgi:hypothetical protein
MATCRYARPSQQHFVGLRFSGRAWKHLFLLTELTCETFAHLPFFALRARRSGSTGFQRAMRQPEEQFGGLLKLVPAIRKNEKINSAIFARCSL